MSENKQIPQPLPKSELPQESWSNKPIEEKPFDQESINAVEYYRDMLKEEEAKSSKFFKIKSGEEIEVYFDMKDPETGYKDSKVLKTNKKTGKAEEVVEKRMNFVLKNKKLNIRQLWVPSNTWALKAIKAMEHYGPGIIISREGEGLETDYDFLAPGFKMAAG